MKTKILTIILIIVINIMFFNINVVQAEGISDVITGGDSFLSAGEDSSTTIDEVKLQSTSTSTFKILSVVGICVAVVVVAILGIKFMLGSAEEKAQVSESLIPFVIGCVVVFGAFGFWKIFVTIGNNFSDEAQLDIAVSQVTGEGGHLYRKGELYCKTCRTIATSSTFESGYCTRSMP